MRFTYGAYAARHARCAMTERELKRLSRMDMLKMMLALSKENEQLRKELAHTKQRLAERTITIQNAGSIAEAALRLNGIFEVAQAAADQYLESLHHVNEGSMGEKEHCT